MLQENDKRQKHKLFMITQSIFFLTYFLEKIPDCIPLEDMEGEKSWICDMTFNKSVWRDGMTGSNIKAH